MRELAVAFVVDARKPAVGVGRHVGHSNFVVDLAAAQRAQRLIAVVDNILAAVAVEEVRARPLAIHGKRREFSGLAQ